MLLTDGNPNGTEDLRVYESSILSVASTETIDLDVKLGLATEEISQDVVDFLLDRTSAVRRSVGASDVAVTRQMKRWHAVHALEIVYRDAFNNQLNDRYKGKFDEYRELARNAREQTFHFGIGLVQNPIPQADTPAIRSVAGALPARTYYARVTWVSSAGQEGSPSDITTFDAPASSVPVVDAVNPPAVAAGFLVYLGLSADAVTLQTSVPIAVGQSFTLAGSGLVMGRAPGDGQAADTFVTGARLLGRG